ncbi:DUF6281 family protein [Streptomyces sp. NPDC101110]|uniref:DUF6281 family protein n=1 Tax=Streptomyces sp. NPDC101110 TaxID=3366104 RepID=UPI0038064EF8
MSWAERSVVALLTAAAAASVSACEPGDSGEAAPSCVYTVTFEGRTYRDVANVDFRVATRLGAATQPPCDDTGGGNEHEEPSTTETAYAVDGISPEVAIAVGGAPDDVLFVAVHSGNGLPPAVKKLIAHSRRPPGCTPAVGGEAGPVPVLRRRIAPAAMARGGRSGCAGSVRPPP